MSLQSVVVIIITITIIIIAVVIIVIIIIICPACQSALSFHPCTSVYSSELAGSLIATSPRALRQRDTKRRDRPLASCYSFCRFAQGSPVDPLSVLPFVVAVSVLCFDPLSVLPFVLSSCFPLTPFLRVILSHAELQQLELDNTLAELAPIFSAQLDADAHRAQSSGETSGVCEEADRELEARCVWGGCGLGWLFVCG